MVYKGYYKVMSNIPKMGQLPTPDGGIFATTFLSLEVEVARKKTKNTMAILARSMIHGRE
jgi:hypothetical protein